MVEIVIESVEEAWALCCISPEVVTVVAMDVYVWYLENVSVSGPGCAVICDLKMHTQTLSNSDNLRAPRP